MLHQLRNNLLLRYAPKSSWEWGLLDGFQQKKIRIVEGLWQAEAGTQFFERKLLVSTRLAVHPGQLPHNCREEWLCLPEMHARGELWGSDRSDSPITQWYLLPTHCHLDSVPTRRVIRILWWLGKVYTMGVNKLLPWSGTYTICDWCVSRWRSKNKHHKYTFSKESGLRLQLLISRYFNSSNTYMHFQ